jgi:glyoxylase-like metal-dependent hydrolase (beta-lactamase superfamily II)
MWHWEAPHPAWEEGQAWGPLVTSYAVEDGSRLLLFDPLAPPDEVVELATGRETSIVLTCPWHVRDAETLARTLDAPLYVPPPDEGDPDPVAGTVFRAGERLPLGVEAFAGLEPNDLVLWLEIRRALVTGDTLVDRGSGLELPRDWLRDVEPDDIVAALRPLLELPVEHVLATHGGPTDRAALERALA